MGRDWLLSGSASWALRRGPAVAIPSSRTCRRDRGARRARSGGVSRTPAAQRSPRGHRGRLIHRPATSTTSLACIDGHEQAPITEAARPPRTSGADHLGVGAGVGVHRATEPTGRRAELHPGAAGRDSLLGDDQPCMVALRWQRGGCRRGRGSVASASGSGCGPVADSASTDHSVAGLCTRALDRVLAGGALRP